MLELSKSVTTTKSVSPAVERFLQSERHQTAKMLGQNAAQAGFSVKKVFGALQKRFSHTHDLPHEIEHMVEAQVQLRTRELFRQANYDSLTHLPNRAYFNTTLEQLVVGAKERESKFALLFLDLDGFKSVNDALGHQAGDDLLRIVSARLISAVREGDIVSRLGGDEFVVLLGDLADRDLIENICKRVIAEVARPYWIDQNDVKISVSIGVSRFPEDAKTSAELIQNSDEALYVSKSSGRNTYRFYDEVINSAPSESHVMQARLETALQNGLVQTCFEPQVDLSSQKIVGASVNAVWRDADLPTPYLAAWLELLNKSSWSDSVGAWLLDTGLFYLQQWQAVNDELVLSVPVMSSLWKDKDLLAFLDERLANYQVNRAQIQLEFSLQSLVEFDSALKETLDRLTDAGYQITLTDVGKFPLDLALLSALNIHEIKLDRSWLQSALATEKGQKWVKAVIQMAKSLDVCVIATGLEQVEHQQMLVKMGCLMGQGSLWSLPISAEAFQQSLVMQ